MGAKAVWEKEIWGSKGEGEGLDSHHLTLNCPLLKRTHEAALFQVRQTVSQFRSVSHLLRLAAAFQSVGLRSLSALAKGKPLAGDAARDWAWLHSKHVLCTTVSLMFLGCRRIAAILIHSYTGCSVKPSSWDIAAFLSIYWWGFLSFSLFYIVDYWKTQRCTKELLGIQDTSEGKSISLWVKEFLLVEWGQDDFFITFTLF